jgi:predicted ATPase
MTPTLKKPETAAEWRAAHDAATTAYDLLWAECAAVLARADLAEARLAKVIQYLHDEAREAHDIFMQPGPPNMKMYHQTEVLEMCLEEARRISKEEKPNRAVLVVKEVE